MNIFDQYKKDVAALLAQATPANLALTIQSIELTSRYAGIALQQVGASTEITRDETQAEALRKSVSGMTTMLPAAMPANDGDEAGVAPAQADLVKVERKLIGAIAGNHFFTEASVRDLDLADGDTVRLSNDEFGDGTSITIVGRNTSTAAPRIVRIHGAVIEKDDKLPTGYQFIAEKDVHGDVLMRTRDNVPVTFLIKQIDVARLALRSGDIVDLAWYSTDGPQQATVSWVYKDKQGLKPKQKHIAKPKKKAAIKAETAATGASAETAAKTYTPRVKFELGGRNVLLVGNVTSQTDIDLVVAAHDGGETTATAATKGTQLKHKLARADVAILITDEVHHITTNTSVKIAKSLKVPYAVANSDAPLVVERALYRAISGMPAYEGAQSDFQYPEI
ncbi:hypothetical protein [Lacticaseibacillus sharpeae]|nr:hypothetical protein [Lacticaseibacillus sharpeae]